MIIQNSAQLEKYRQAAKIATQILAQMREAVKPGVYPIEIDQLAEKLCQENGVVSSFKGVKNQGLTYQYQSCISVNDEILHGIPSRDRAIQTGDLVKLDFGIIYQGLHTDQCVTVGVGEVSPENLELLKVGKQAVLKAVKLAVKGNRTGQLGQAMQQTSYVAGYDVLKEYVGHGIGLSLHEDPEIPAYGQPHQGAKLKEGQVICVECQVVPGSDEVYTTSNGWTVKIADGNPGVMFEYMVIVGKKHSEILTNTVDWPLVV